MLSDSNVWRVQIRLDFKRNFLNDSLIYLYFLYRTAKEFSTIWADLALCLEGYLFPNCSQLMVSVEELQQDEMLDVKLVHIIRDNILPFANEMPKVFVLQIVSILNRGSIHSATSISPVGKLSLESKNQLYGD